MAKRRRIREWLRASARRAAELPLPPAEMRELIGPLDDSFFDNPDGRLIHGDDLPREAYDAVLDIGCGCGRLARKLIQQNPQPREYVGIDLHRGMVNWCRENLAPHAPQFRFEHHDVLNIGLNPGAGKPTVLPLPESWTGVGFSLVEAISVFTHMVEHQAVHYLYELRRVLRPNGVAATSWFVFDKAEFPMMQDFQNTLFINDVDPTNAVIFDRGWLRRTANEAGLTVYRITPPVVRGHQWTLFMTPTSTGAEEADWPADMAPAQRMASPVPTKPAHTIGLD
jgi:SAM-dependent methyltransferase